MKKPIKKKNKKEEITIEKRVELYMKEISKTASKLELGVRPIVNFKKGKPSILGRIAISLLRLSGGFLDTQFTNLKK